MDGNDGQVVGMDVVGMDGNDGADEKCQSQSLSHLSNHWLIIYPICRSPIPYSQLSHKYVIFIVAIDAHP